MASRSLSAQDVRDIARLARLQLDDADIESLRGELSAILDYMDALRSLETDGVPPMTHAVPAALRCRPDDADESLPADVALSGAPARADDFFQVPNILDCDRDGGDGSDGGGR